MTTPETPEDRAIPLAGKALAASGIALVASMTASNVWKDNVSKTISSLSYAEELGKRAKNTGLYEDGLNSLKAMNADVNAFRAFELYAGLPPGKINVKEKKDPLSTFTRKGFGAQSFDVKMRSGDPARQRQSELTETSTIAQPEISDEGKLLGNEAQVEGEVSQLISCSPPSKSTAEFSSPPFVIYQLVFIISASVFAGLVSWFLARFLFKPSK